MIQKEKYDELCSKDRNKIQTFNAIGLAKRDGNIKAKSERHLPKKPPPILRLRKIRGKTSRKLKAAISMN